MPREIRTIKRTFFTDEKLATVSRGARLTFIGLLPNADDYGRMKGDPRLLKAVIYPLDDDITAADVSAEIDDLEAIGVVRRYEVSGTPYLEVVNFDRHQVMNRKYKSDIPLPLEPGGTDASAVPTHGARTAHALRTHGRSGAERSGEERTKGAERSGGPLEQGSEPELGEADLLPSASPPLASPSAPPKSKPRQHPPPAGVAAFLRVCYDHTPEAQPTERVAQVMQELRATLTADGAPLEGERVHAYSIAHLNDVCRAVADKPPKKRNVGVHFVLLKLRDTYLEVKAAAEKPKAARGNGGSPTAIGEVVTTPTPATSDAEIEAYFAAPEHFKQAKQIQQDIAHQFASWPKNDALARTADAALRQALRQAYEQRDPMRSPAAPEPHAQEAHADTS